MCQKQMQMKDGLRNHLIKIFNKTDADKGWAEEARKY